MCSTLPNKSLFVTRDDAAWFELTWELRRLQNSLQTLVGFAERLNGKRVVEKGLPPSRSIPLS
jgi:hypothetical protein